MMANKETIVKVIKKEIIVEPEPSEEVGYQTFTVKEEFLEEDWTEQSEGRQEIFTEPKSTEQPETYVSKEDELADGWTEDGDQEIVTELKSTDQPESFMVKEEPLSDGWTDDNEAAGVCGEAQTEHVVQRRVMYHTDSLKEGKFADGLSEEVRATEDFKESRLLTGEAVHRACYTDSLQEEDDWTEDHNAKERETELSEEADYEMYFVSEEHLDNDCTRDDCADLQVKLQGGNTKLKNGISSQMCTPQIPSVGGQHLGHRAYSSQRASGTSNLENSHLSMISTSHMSSVGQHSPSPAELRTQSDSSERESEYSLSYDYNACDQEPSIAERETSNKVAFRYMYQCPICRMEFSSEGGLKHHIETHDADAAGTKNKPLQCVICRKWFSQKVRLKSHMRTHTEEKLFQCFVCNTAFYEKCLLIRHLRTHTGEKPYQCSVCNTKFSDTGALSRHVRTHTGEKPFQCSVCNKSFTQSGDLDIHKRTHTGEKPFRCSVCDKGFSGKSCLKRHMRTHTGEKPYQCSICSESFARKDNLTSHVIKIHTS